MRDKNKPYRVVLGSTNRYCKKGTILRSANFNEAIVVRRYRKTWLRLLLKWLGIKTNINVIKVKNRV